MPIINACNSVIINANDYAVVIARGESKVTACHNTLVFLQDDAVCKAADNARVITRSQNKPDFLKTNVRYILDHPFVKGNPSTAISLLIASADPRDIDNFSKKLWEMGCIDPKSTKQVLQSMARETNSTIQREKGGDHSLER
jgi:hypothetical protein